MAAGFRPVWRHLNFSLTLIFQEVSPFAFYHVNKPPSEDYSPLTLTLGQEQYAVRSFKPFKKPAPDDIIASDIQHGEEIIILTCSPFLGSLMEVASIAIKDTASLVVLLMC